MERILIVGAGYAGVVATRELERLGHAVTLVNREPYHQLTTWLHEAAGGRNQVDDYKIDLAELFSGAEVTIAIDEMVSLNWKDRVFTGRKGSYAYDYAIVGLGSVPEYFNIEGLSAHSLPLKSLDSARVIRRHIGREFKKYAQHPEAYRLRVIIGGAGLTGVEFAGELAEWLPELCQFYKIKVKPEIICVEAMPDILPTLPNSLRDKAERELEAAGVRFMTDSKIARVDGGAIILESGKAITAGTIVWTGGVRAHPLLSEAGLQCDRKGRAYVTATLQSVDDQRLWIVGDCADFEKNGKPLPPTGQLATQMGKHAAQNLHRQLQGERQAAFSPKIYGTLASLGSVRGVGDVVGVRTSGRFAGIFKELSKVKYLAQIGGLRMVERKRKPLVLEPQ